MDDSVYQAELVDDVLQATVVDAEIASSTRHSRSSRIAFAITWIVMTLLIWLVEHRSVELLTPIGILPVPVESGHRQIYGMVSRLLVAPIFGFSIAFALQQCVLWRNGIGPVYSPGHCVLFQFAVWTLGRLFVGGLVWSGGLNTAEGNKSASEQFPNTLMLLVLLPILASGFIAGCVFFVERFPRRWRWYFGANAVMALLLLLCGACLLLPSEVWEEWRNGAVLLMVIRAGGSFILSCIVGVSFLMCLVGDLGDQTSRYDRYHWCGVAMIGFYWLLIIADSSIMAI